MQKVIVMKLLFFFTLLVSIGLASAQTSDKKGGETLYIQQMQNPNPTDLEKKVSLKLKEILSKQHSFVSKQKIQNTFQKKVISSTKTSQNNLKFLEKEILPFLKKGEDLFYQSDFAGAIAAYQEGFIKLAKDPSIISGIPNMESKIFNASLIYIRSLMASGQSSLAEEQIRWTIITFPNKTISLKEHPPDVITKYQETKSKVYGEVGALEVTVAPKSFEDSGQCIIYLNGVNIGFAPVSFPKIPVGSYYIQAVCGDKTSWIYQVRIPKKRVRAIINVEFPELVHFTPSGDILVGKTDKDAMLDLGKGLGELLETDQILVSRFVPDEKEGMMKIEVYNIDVTSGEILQKTFIEAKIKDENVELKDWKPTQTEDQATIEKTHKLPPKKKTVWPYVTLGTGIGLIGGGAILHVLYNKKVDDASKSGDNVSSGMKTGSIIMYSLGGATLVASIVLFILEYTGKGNTKKESPQDPKISGGISPTGVYMNVTF